MSPLESVVLGVVQGLTEFLPISSTAHLRIVPALFGWQDPGAAFTAVTQLGTMAAVLIFFRRDLARIVLTWVRSLRDPALRGSVDARLGWYIGLGTIPIAVLGFLFRDQISTGARKLPLIAAALILLALVLAYAERVGRRDRGLETINLRDGLAIGAAQASALIPGVSRSGATISAGLFLGLGRADAARYSFLLSIPAVVLSGVFELRDIGNGGGPGAVSTAVATVLAFVVGYASIAFLLRFLVNHSTMLFVAYRVALGVLVFVLLGTNVIA